jgi:hypothetical protein
MPAGHRQRAEHQGKEPAEEFYTWTSFAVVYPASKIKTSEAFTKTSDVLLY